MEVTIRDMTPADAKLIMDLRRDPRLRTMQYMPSAHETPEALLAVVQPGLEIPRAGWKCSTILVDGNFAGHITEIYSLRGQGTSSVLLGWNLLPELWGKGVMPQALELLLEIRCAAKPDIEFIACCFASNSRCVRVIEKLGFRGEPLTLIERLSHFTQTWGRQRVVKFRLTHATWHIRRMGKMAESRKLTHSKADQSTITAGSVLN